MTGKLGYATPTRGIAWENVLTYQTLNEPRWWNEEELYAIQTNKTNNLDKGNAAKAANEAERWSEPISRRLALERGSSVVEYRTHNQVSPGSNPSLLPFRRLGIFILSIDTPVHSAV